MMRSRTKSIGDKGMSGIDAMFLWMSSTSTCISGVIMSVFTDEMSLLPLRVWIDATNIVSM